MFDVITYALCKKLIKDAQSESGKLFTLKGTVASINELPLTNNSTGDVYLVGPKSDGSYDEYFWNDVYGWDPIGTTSIELDEYINEENLYKGSDGTGTIEAPAQDTIIYVLNTIYTKQEDINDIVKGIIDNNIEISFINENNITNWDTVNIINSSVIPQLTNEQKENIKIMMILSEDKIIGIANIISYNKESDNFHLVPTKFNDIRGLKNYYTKTEIDNIIKDYVKFDDYATESKAGVIKSSASYGLKVTKEGFPYLLTFNKEEYSNLSDASFISKGTLDILLEGAKQIEFLNRADFPIIGNENVLDVDDNIIYKWNNEKNDYIEINGSLNWDVIS